LFLNFRRIQSSL